MTQIEKTQIEKIRAEIERLIGKSQEGLQDFENQGFNTYELIERVKQKTCQQILSFIDSSEAEEKPESEDERIRKTLIHIVKGACDKYGIKYRGDDITKEKLIAYLERQKEQKPAEQYSIGKTFMGLIPCWINAPSELQPAHKYHGKNAVIMRESNGGFRCCFIDDEKATTVHLPENTLFVERWRKRHTEWNKEDEGMLNCIIATLCEESHGGRETNNKMVTWLENRLKSLRPQPHWKPSEVQMEALAWYSGNSGVPPTGDKAIKSLYNDLKKL